MKNFNRIKTILCSKRCIFFLPVTDFFQFVSLNNDLEKQADFEFLPHCTSCISDAMTTSGNTNETLAVICSPVNEVFRLSDWKVRLERRTESAAIWAAVQLMSCHKYRRQEESVFKSLYSHLWWDWFNAGVNVGCPLVRRIHSGKTLCQKRFLRVTGISGEIRLWPSDHMQRKLRMRILMSSSVEWREVPHVQRQVSPPDKKWLSKTPNVCSFVLNRNLDLILESNSSSFTLKN